MQELAKQFITIMKYINEVLDAQLSEEQKELLLQLKDDFPRRARIDLLIPAEKIIYDAMQAVEKLPADLRLTNAVIDLGKARDWVADYVDDAKRNIDSRIPGTSAPTNQIDNDTERLLVEFGNYLFQKYDVQVFSNDGKNTPLYQRGIHDADIKNFYHQHNLVAPELRLPSAFQNGDRVRLSFADVGKIDNCEVIKVHFTESKVLYDVSVEMTIEGEKYHTRLYNIDSAMVRPS